jgi:hypothetical protein
VLCGWLKAAWLFGKDWEGGGCGLIKAPEIELNEWGKPTAIRTKRLSRSLLPCQYDRYSVSTYWHSTHNVPDQHNSCECVFCDVGTDSSLKTIWINLGLQTANEMELCCPKSRTQFWLLSDTRVLVPERTRAGHSRRLSVCLAGSGTAEVFLKPRLPLATERTAWRSGDALNLSLSRPSFPDWGLSLCGWATWKKK